MSDKIVFVSGENETTFVQVGGQGPAGPVGPVGPAGPSAHSGLMGLSNDDHLQYHTDARGDARYPAETTSTVGTLIAGAGAKSAPVDADSLGLSDSEAGGILRKFTWASLKSALAGIFAASSKGVTNGDAHDHSGGDGAQIAYNSLAGLPTLGTAATADIGTSSGDVAAFASNSVLNIAMLSGLTTVGHLNIQRQTDGANVYLDCISDHTTNGHCTYNFRRANGTPGALTAVQSGDEYGALACRVYNGSAWENHSGSLSWGATENHTAYANGSGVSLYTILNGTVGSWKAIDVDGVGKTTVYGGLQVYGSAVSSIDCGSVIPASATVSFNGINVQLYTAADSFTLADLYLHRIKNTTKGSGSTISRQTGIRIEDLTVGASNFGFRSLLSAGSGKWNLFVDGTADNYIVGKVGLGTNAPTQPLDVSGSKIRIRLANTPASATDTGAVGEICWDSNYVYVCVATNSWKRASIGAW